MKAALFYDNSDTFREPVMVHETLNANGKWDLEIHDHDSAFNIDDVDFELLNDGRRIYYVEETPWTTLYYEILE